jgi:ferredoxin
MSHQISDDCTTCGACASACPVEAIKEDQPKFKIDADACIDCGQCVDECPVGAISAG